MNGNTSFRTLTLMAAAAGALALGACSRQDEPSAGQQIDEAVAKTEQKAQQAQQDLQREAAELKAATERAAEQVANKAESAADKMGNAVSDAAVSAGVKAELIKDPDLRALQIQVDTQNGKVLLTGHAPSAAARDRATHLAYAVKGVASVDNRLQISG